MVRQIVPLFFTMDIPATLAYYKEKLGFECLGTWHDPPVYAIVAVPRAASSKLSVRSCCSSRARVQPTAKRTAISRRLAEARVNSRLAIFAQAIRSTSATTPIST